MCGSRMHIHISHIQLTCTVMILTCSIHSMVEGSPSRTAHMWLTCTVMILTCSIHSMVEGDLSHAAFTQWWRGTPHIQLMYSCVAHVHSNASRVALPQWWRETPHVQHSLSGRGETPHMQHSLNGGGGSFTCNMNHVWLTCTVMPLTCSIHTLIKIPTHFTNSPPTSE